MREAPDRPFARDGGRTITFAAAHAEVVRFAGALRAAGLESGDRFAFLAKNCVEFAVAYLAASASETVIVPLNYRLALPEWSHLLLDAGVKVLIARGDLAGAIDPIRPDHSAIERWVSIDGPPLLGWIGYRDWLHEPSAPLPDVTGAQDELCQMYTSGTTGRPKGAILTHRSISSNASQMALAIGEPIRPGEWTLVVMPVFHAGAASQVFSAMLHGASLAMVEDFDPDAVVRGLTEPGVVITSLVPAMIRACLDQVTDIGTRTFPTLRAIFYGASPIDRETLRRALAAMPVRFFQAYGMTETSVVLTVLSPADHDRALADRPELLLSAGRAIPGTELRIVDADDQPVPVGVPGQIVARGPQLMKGYWRRPDATAAALAGGWMHTGDVGRLDEEGYLYLLDRVHDTIISGGENIYPREVEDAIMTCAGVQDAAVVGIPDDRFGETVLAFVVRRPEAGLTGEAIIAHCRERIAGYKVPRAVEFVPALPRNPTGKVLKRELREPYWQGRSRRIG
jgi:acyl-CoA synthetase (AMP-forming)/AMP-acid ligase II